MLLDLADSQRIPPGALLVGLVGTVPFWVLAGLSFGWSPAVSATLAMSAIVAYGALALAFLGGIRWGLAVGPYGGHRPEREFALSALAPLAGFAAIFLAPVLALSLLIAALLLIALWDVASAEKGRLPAWFSRLRALLTGLALPPLLAVLGRAVLASVPQG